MAPRITLLLALAALLSTQPWGLLTLIPARLAGAGGWGLLGLALLSTSGRRAEPRVENPAAQLAGTLEGVWEPLGGRRARLHLEAGSLFVHVGSAVAEAAPGTRVRISVRGEADRPPTAVALHALSAAPAATLVRLRAHIRETLRDRVRRPERGLLRSLILGERDELHGATREDARRTGTAHLLALSGLHVALLAGVLHGARRLAWSRELPLVTPLLIGFALLLGPRAPLWRATLGRLLLRVGTWSGRHTDSAQRLLVAALALALWRPALFGQLSAQLSFLAVAGMIAVSRVLPRGPAQWLCPAGAFLGTAPLVVETFGELQPWGLLITPLLVPLLAATLALGLALLLSEALSTALGDALAWAAAQLADLYLDALERIGSVVPDPLRPVELPVPGLLASWIVLAALLALKPRANSRVEDRSASAMLEVWS